MKRKLFTTTTLLFCVAVCFAVVADLTGKWTGTLKANEGSEFPVNYEFKVDGNKLTGTGSTPNGEVPIADGKITGDTFSFTVPYDGMDIKNTGKFYASGDSIGLDVDYNGNNLHAMLKRNDK